MTEGEQREEKQEGGCDSCAEDFLKEVCDQLPDPYNGKCRKLLEDLRDGKITTWQFAVEGQQIPGLLEKFQEYSCSTKKEE